MSKLTTKKIAKEQASPLESITTNLWIEKNRELEKTIEKNCTSCIELPKSKEGEIALTTNDLSKILQYIILLPSSMQVINYIILNVLKKHRLVNEDGSEIKEDHVVAKFFREVNSNSDNIKDLLKGYLSNEICFGNGYIELEVTTDEKDIVHLWNISPMFMRAIYSKKEFDEFCNFRIKHYIKRKDFKGIKNQDVQSENSRGYIKKEHVIHGKYLDGEIYGRTPFQNEVVTSEIILKIMNLHYNKLSNNIYIPLHIIAKGMKPKEIQKMKNRFLSTFATESNYGKAFISDEDVEIKEIVKDSKELDYITFMETWGKRHVAKLFGVQYSEIDNTDSKYNNAERGYKSTMESVIIPLQEKIERLVNDRILPMIKGGDKVRFLLDRPKIGARYDLVLPMLKALELAVITPNEFRKTIDSDSFPRVDKDYFDKFYLHRSQNVEEFVPIENSSTSEKRYNVEQLFDKVEDNAINK